MASTSAAASRMPGRVRTDIFGCTASRLVNDQALPGADMAFFHKTTGGDGLERVSMEGSARGTLLGLAASGGHRRSIFNGRRATHHTFEAGSLYLRDLDEPYRADLSLPFDFVLLEISPAGLERIGEEAGLDALPRLEPQTAVADPILAALLQALIPALARPQEASRLFIDQMATVIGTHLFHRFDIRPTRTPAKPRGLTAAQEGLAKALLLEHLAGDIAVQTVASACGLSRGHFIAAFRRTTGLTPHRWLVRARIERARELMRGSALPLAEIAIACGFADQSHFTRAFTSLAGTSPGAWRRAL